MLDVLVCCGVKQLTCCSISSVESSLSWCSTREFSRSLILAPWASTWSVSTLTYVILFVEETKLVGTLLPSSGVTFFPISSAETLKTSFLILNKFLLNESHSLPNDCWSEFCQSFLLSARSNMMSIQEEWKILCTSPTCNTPVAPARSAELKFNVIQQRNY